METNKHNPDNRLDNVEKLQDAIRNTEENIHAANDTMAFSSSEDKEAIRAKNDRRQESIKGMRAEIQDENAARESGYQNENQYE